MQRFGEKLRTLRKRHELTLSQLGEMLGVSHTYVSRLESGVKTPNVAMLLKIADVFEVCVDRLVRDELELDEDE